MSSDKDYCIDYKRLEEIGRRRWDNLPETETEKPVFDLSLGNFTFRASEIVPIQSTYSNDLHFIIAHSKEHSHWAAGLEKQVIDSVHDVFPAIKISTEFLPIKGTVEEVTQTLTDYQATYREKAAGQTFIVTLGWQESQMISAANNSKVLPYPQLFCVPGIPGGLLHEAGLAGNSNMIGGVYSTPIAPHDYVSSILSFFPQTQVVCIAYEPNPENVLLASFTAERVKGIEEAFNKKNISIIHHHWTPEDSNMAHLRNIMYSADSIIILNEPAAEMHRKRVIRLCNVLGKFICASELDSVFAGAALGGGICGSAFGIPLASLITDYLLAIEDKTTKLGWYLYQIPEQTGMRYNKWAFGMQGIQLDEEKDALLRMKSAFDDSCIEF